MAGGTTQRSISPPQSAQATVDALEAVNRERPLTSDEEQRLYRALDSIRRRQGKRENWHWSRADKLRLRRHLLYVQRLIGDHPNKARRWSTSTNWVGHLIAEAVDKDSHDKKDAAALKRMLDTWIAEGALKVVEREDSQRRMREFVEVGTWASN